MVLVIVDLKSHQALPISYIFIAGKKDPHHIPGPERAIGLIEEAISNGFPPPLPVTSDSWFGSKEFIKSVRQLGCEFAGELKSNRITRLHISPGTEKKLDVGLKNFHESASSKSGFISVERKEAKLLVN